MNRGADRLIFTGQHDHRVDHKINRHQVQAHVTIADVQERQSARPFAQVVNQIIDAVVLGSFASARVAAHNRRPMNRDRQLRLQRLNFHLREVLGLFVVIAEACIVEQLTLHDDAFALAGHIARRHVVISPQIIYRTSEPIHVARTIKVHAQG